MTNVKIISGSNGSGKSLYLSNLYKEKGKEAIFFSDSNIFLIFQPQI